MTLRIKPFGPEQLLSSPRRTAALPSPDGKYYTYVQSSYNFEKHEKFSKIVVIELSTGKETVVSEDLKAGEPQWLTTKQLIYLKSDADDEKTTFSIYSIDTGKTQTSMTVNAPLSNLKVRRLSDTEIVLAVSASANPDGSLHKPKDVPKALTTAKVYDALFVRHWTEYKGKEHNSVFTTLLNIRSPRLTNDHDEWEFSELQNILHEIAIDHDGSDEGYSSSADQSVEFRTLECPIPPFGGTDHYDLHDDGIVIVAKDPQLNPATHTKCNAYWIELGSWTVSGKARKIKKLNVKGFLGAATSPVVSKDGNLAFLQMRTDGYESDKNEIIVYLKGGAKDINEKYVHARNVTANRWDRSPSSLIWSEDGTTLYALAEDYGTACVFAINVTDPASHMKLTNTNSVSHIAPLQSGELLITASSLTSSSIVTVLDPLSNYDLAQTLSDQQSFSRPAPSTIPASAFGLSDSQVSSITWKGDNNHDVHAWVMKPSKYESNKKYPLAYLVHGGPQGAWMNSWSTRWNPAVFAEQGYVVIMPNPTGSTGYGQAFTDAINRNWGGSPYIDLLKGMEYITSKMSDVIDVDKCVALGASYGGFMMNWIQGHPELAKYFKCLVCHDGVFSMPGQLASEELYFPIHDLGGKPWLKSSEGGDDIRAVWRKWDPSALISEWTTPMLVIHNELDYRLTISEGLQMFNVLQGKGIESRMLIFTDEGHFVLKQENSLIWHLVVLNWINRFVGLPVVKDRLGRTGDEFVMTGKRKVPSDK